VKTIVLLTALILSPVWGQYTIVQNSPYQAAVAVSGALSVNQTSGNTNIGGTAFCPNAGCSSATCPTSSFTDNAGSHGGSGNNTYTADQNSSAAALVCVDLGRAFNITNTTSTNTVTATTSGASYQVTVAVEVNGLGVSPSLESVGSGSSASLTTVSTSGSCTAGDFAISYWYSNTQPSAGSGWTAIDTPFANQIMIWQVVGSTGVVTATVSGTGATTGGAIACYKPTAAATNSNQPLPLTGVAMLRRAR